MADWGPLYWVIAALLVGVVLAAVVMPFLRPRAGRSGGSKGAAGRTRHPSGIPASVPLVLTKHVKQRMSQRDIPEAWLRGTVANPMRVTPDAKERSRKFEQVFDETHDAGTGRGNTDVTVRHTVKVWVSDADGWPPRKEAVVKSTAAQRSAAVRVRRDQVGALIGKGGSGIRRIEAASGARVHVDDDGRVLITADTVDLVLRGRAMVVAAVR